MQAALSAVNQELTGGSQSHDKLFQLVTNVLSQLKLQKTAKPDIPPGTVSSIATIVLANSHCEDAALVLTCLRCLQQIAHLLGNAVAPVLRLEGALPALLSVLQSSGIDHAVASACVHLLNQLSAASSAALTALVDAGGLAALLRLLETSSSHERLVTAVLELLALASKGPKAAANLATKQQLVPTMRSTLNRYAGNPALCGAVLKCLRRLAKQPACRSALVDAGAVPVLLSAAQHMASAAGQHRQVKRACRAVWLLKGSSCLLPLPQQEPCWLPPSRTAPHLNMASAMETDVARLQQLFPELQAACVASKTGLTAQTGVSTCAADNAATSQVGVRLNTGAAADGVCLATDGLSVSGKAVPLASTVIAVPAGSGAAAATILPKSNAGCSLDLLGSCPNAASGIAATFEELVVCEGLPKLGVQLPLGPPLVTDITAAARLQQEQKQVQAEEPFHASEDHLIVQNMLHDLRRLQCSRDLINAVVYDSMQPQAQVLQAATSQPLLSSNGSDSCSSGCCQECEATSASSGNIPRALSKQPNVVSCAAPAADLKMGRTVGGTSSHRHQGIGNMVQSSTIISLQQDGTAVASSPAVQLESATQPGVLQFDSHFESGNLRMAVHVRDNEYDLFMSNDVNDRSPNSNSTQWFYFAVWNALPGTTYKLNLVNFNKPNSMYSTCRRPLMCCCTPRSRPSRCTGAATVAPEQSGSQAQEDAASLDVHGAALAVCQGASECTATQHAGSPKIGWYRIGYDIAYYPSPYRGRPVATVSCTPINPCSSSSKSGVLSKKQATATSQKKPTHKGSTSTPQYAGIPPKQRSRQNIHSNASSGGTAACRRQAAEEKAAAVNSSSSSTSWHHNSRRVTADSIGAAAASSAAPGRRVSHGARRHTTEAAIAAACQSSGGGPVTTCISPEPHTASGKVSNAAETVIDSPVGPGLYSLTFQLEFPCSGMYAICSCYPYTYSDLQEQLAALVLRCNLRLLPGQACPVVRSLLCRTLAGRRCDLLTITEFAAGAGELADREYVVITARVHPGETCASWIAQGAVDFLVSDAPLAQRLRRYFVFKVIPMLNPDGVVLGNYRASLAGVDLNRQWDKAVQQVQPTIFHARKLLEALTEAGRLALTIDIHGHSSALDAFFYGCEPLLPNLTAAERKAIKAARAVPLASDMQAAGGAVALKGSSCQEAASSSSRCSSRSSSRCSSSCSSSRESSMKGENYAVNAVPLPGVEAVYSADAAGGQLAKAGEELSVANSSAVVPTVEAAGCGRAQEQQSQSHHGTASMAAAGLSAAPIARLRVRMLPYLASLIHSSYDLHKCRFKTQKSKAGTARVVAARQLGVPGAYTLEASLTGSSVTQSHFTVRDYLELGECLMTAVGQLAEADDQLLLGKMAANIVMPALPGHPGSGNVAARATQCYKQ